jgi:uncharacterized protein YdiU (UPF0061 family)
VYNPAVVFSSIDHMGRYAYANQPRIGLWNLTRLAETLLPLLAEEQGRAVAQAQETLSGFGPQFELAYQGGLRRKLGLFTEQEGDPALAGDLLQTMAENQADFTLTFRRLCDAAAGPDHDGPVRDLFVDPTAFDRWASRWRDRLRQEPQDGIARGASMRAVNPAYIPRNHRIEAVITAAVEREDFAPFEELLTVLFRPYEDQPEFAAYAKPPEPHERVQQTFCGT